MVFEIINLGTQPAGTGGDTARSSFEKVNRNFLAADVLSAAMSQAQFEAIRAQNNEEFAASGFVHFGQQVLASAVNEGLTTSITVPNNLWIGIHDAAAGRGGKSKTKNPVINIAGTIFYIDRLAQTFEYLSTIKFPQAPDGKTTYNKSTGVITTHATVTAAFNAQVADPTNVEVVTDRVDMWGFEAFLEEVNTTNPYVYPNGLIQSQAATMDGIATSASARPVTYYAVFDGDTGSKGKGLNFFALTDVQKKKVLANPKNNLYYLDDGRLAQWRLRQRTVSGAGNGDWAAIDSSVSNSYGLLPSTATGSQLYRPQGNNDLPYANTAYWCPASQKGVKVTWGWPSHTDVGIYQASRGNNGLAVNSVNGECYFLVCGTVNRLNQGLYHPSYNAGGAAKAVGDTFWYNTAASITSKADCFDATKLLANSGIIASGKLGRPDGRYYDAIYADGQGGVCRDMRYSAYGVDAVDFAEADKKVKNGTYRGVEKLIFSRVTATQNSVPNNSTINFASAVPSWVKVGDTVISVSGVRSKIGSMSANSIFTLTNNGVMVNEPIVIENEQPYSVGGSFLQTDVVGNPANILATPQLANGWQGSWIPEIPDGLKDYFTFTRKYIGSGADVARTYTSNNGSSWTTGMILVNAIPSNQSQFDNMPADYIVMYQYKAFAKQTENAVNAVVYGGNLGIGKVWEYSGFYPHTWGNALQESLLGKIGVSADSNLFLGSVPLTYSALRLTGEQDTFSARFPTHTPINLSAPTNSSSGVKALDYNVNINQQAFIQYAYTELKHNGSSWGDDGKVTIVDNQATKTDQNGNIVLVGTAKLKEPIGWVKNKM